VAGGDLGLQDVRSPPTAEGLGPLEGSEPMLDQEAVPPGAVLVGEEDRLAVGLVEVSYWFVRSEAAARFKRWSP
jgi:hypothetical protein